MKKYAIFYLMVLSRRPEAVGLHGRVAPLVRHATDGATRDEVARPRVDVAPHLDRLPSRELAVRRDHRRHGVRTLGLWNVWDQPHHEKEPGDGGT